MDPPVMMNGGGEFRSAGNSCNLAEIMPPFDVDFGGGNATSFNGMIHVYMNNGDDDVCVGVDDDDDPMDLDQKGSNFYGNKKKRRGEEDDDDSPKRVSISSLSNGNGNGNGNGMNDYDGKRLRIENGSSEPKAKAYRGSGKRAENHTKPTEPKQDYIHVRARRGQATDSHSLAERARREKINERMKILQDLVPGCNKVIGKALVLDEIINYIQALQRQVELGHRTFEMSFVSQPMTREFSRTSSPEWLHMQIGGSFERTT
ncbi:hypothetical protein OSB04_018420 [Centaurea solstitialis]|uniref:BHLH domain-containing protein n=1 Tax=Centaurea solstitialis TaxID=347529 RepID=A0AA38WJB2_9ASTR|nr:hypothetical protein OSB04_018420 [Centaurea solstitialis]